MVNRSERALQSQDELCSVQLRRYTRYQVLVPGGWEGNLMS